MHGSTTSTAQRGDRPFGRALDPGDRVSEILFGLIMVLTSTGTLSVFTAGRAEVATMIVGALGCNLAWGIIDAGMYLMSCLDERARFVVAQRNVRAAADDAAVRNAVSEALPAPISAILSDAELQSIGRRVAQLPPPERPKLAADDWLGALAVGVLVFLSTFPVVVPFLIFDQVQPALRVSNAIAIAMLFLCGLVYGRHTGLRPWLTGIVMVAIGVLLTGVAILLGG